MVTAFAIMRPDGGIRSRALIWTAATWAVWWIAAMPRGVLAAAADSARWLPVPVEEVEAPERLDLAPRDSSTEITVRAALRDGRLAVTRMDSARSGRSTRFAFSTLGAVGAPSLATAAIGWERTEIAAGALSAQGAGVLFGSELGFSRRASRPPGPRVAIPEIGAPAGASSPLVRGIGVRREEDAGGRIAGMWLMAGRRREDGALVEVAGALARLGRTMAGLALGATETDASGGGIGSAIRGLGFRTTVLSATAWIPTRSGSVSAEWLLSRRGGAALLEATTASRPLRLSGRWRYEAWSPRPTTAELIAEMGSSRSRARLTMATAPAASSAADLAAKGAPAGSVQLEGRWAPRGHSVLARVGRTGDQRFAVLDATVARGDGRALALVTTRRERRGPGGAEQVGASLGGRLDLVRRGMGALELTAEAVRVGGGFSAWSRGLSASGATTLRSLTRPGLAVSVRGWLEVGRIALGGVLTSVETGSGRPATAATIWVERRRTERRGTRP